MTGFTDAWVIPWLAFLAEWSIRWGVLLALIAAWFALHPPRRAATRHVLCLAAIVSGLLIPFAPRWGGLPVPWWTIDAAAEGEPTIQAVSLCKRMRFRSRRPPVRRKKLNLIRRELNPRPLKPPRTQSRSVDFSSRRWRLLWPGRSAPWFC